MRRTHRSPRPRGERPRFELADIFRDHGEAYRHRHALTSAQWKAMRAIERCRTAQLGGHLDRCDRCDHEVPAYNSCRNRHCPKCQGLAQQRWVERQQERVLDSHYFHVVFTIPSQLHDLVRANPNRLFKILFAAAAKTLLQLGRDKKRLGAELGITAVLHTWTRALLFHPHVHCIVTGGGLDEAGTTWVEANKKYLFPVRVLSRLFRGKFVAALRRAYERGRLRFDGPTAHLAKPDAFRALLDSLFEKEWVVYAKRPFGGPEQVFAYLGRYTHRVAISNHRLLDVGPEHVRFRAREGKTVTVHPQELIRRFLLHVLPHAFVKIRHFGLLASRRAEQLRRARLLLNPRASTETPRPAEPVAPPIVRCPLCQLGIMQPWPLSAFVDAVIGRDTS